MVARKRRLPLPSSPSVTLTPAASPKKARQALPENDHVGYLGSPVDVGIFPEIAMRDSPSGYRAWKKDHEDCKTKWVIRGAIEGYAGMVGTIERYRTGDADDSARFKLIYEDIEGDPQELIVDIAFESLETYPSEYRVLVFSEVSLTRQARTSFARFSDIYDLDISSLISQLLSSLQGDDEAGGGQPRIETDEDDYVESDNEPEYSALGRGFEVAKGSFLDLGENWTILKEHFAQAKACGYRPGFTSVSDFWVISLSVPLKSLPIDPNILSIWDEGLVAAWSQNQRFTLLIGVDSYPPHPDQMRYWLGLDINYKPSSADTIATTRGQGIQPFYLSTALISFLKTFPNVHKIRTSHAVDWPSANSIAFDAETAMSVFQMGKVPPGSNRNDEKDPVQKGFQMNIPLCAFYWVIRRFLDAPKYCMSCGLEVALPSLRPYVCERPLCLYGYMSLGLGPSVEYTIINQPSVVDLLLTFAHVAAFTKARMDLPLQLHIEVPIAFGIGVPTLIDNLSPENRYSALFWLIEQLPKVSEIKLALESGTKLHQLECPSGSVGILRWVIGSSRAYLKESRPGEGLLHPNDKDAVEKMRQFAFVVGAPEIESNYGEEIASAKEACENCVTYPSLLAFHGSPLACWHNILRTGLDFQETRHGRAYGNGVYFASEYETSAGYTMRIAPAHRSNADSSVNTAMALVELVNRPDTFVSTKPYYVVSNTKQIKHFLLLVSGFGDVDAAAAMESGGELFMHDPKLARETSYKGKPVRVKMPLKLAPATFVDVEPDDEQDQMLMSYEAKKTIKLFKPSSPARFAKLERMPPPTETSVVATRALSKEFKSLIKAQSEGSLPFHLDPETDSLYCWTMELYEFPSGSLKTELEQKTIPSVIAEIRFPASFPHSPPFMRVLHPRFLPFSQGGGGNITAGGSICNEILTSTGWNPAFCIEAIVRDVMTNMTEATPPAILNGTRWDQPYSLHEAMEAYRRVARAHDWSIPKDFDKMAR